MPRSSPAGETGARCVTAGDGARVIGAFALAWADGKAGAVAVRRTVQPVGRSAITHAIAASKERCFMNQWREYSCPLQELQERELRGLQSAEGRASLRRTDSSPIEATAQRRQVCLRERAGEGAKVEAIEADAHVAGVAVGRRHVQVATNNEQAADVQTELDLVENFSPSVTLCAPPMILLEDAQKLNKDLHKNGALRYKCAALREAPERMINEHLD